MPKKTNTKLQPKQFLELLADSPLFKAMKPMQKVSLIFTAFKSEQNMEKTLEIITAEMKEEENIGKNFQNVLGNAISDLENGLREIKFTAKKKLAKSK